MLVVWFVHAAIGVVVVRAVVRGPRELLWLAGFLLPLGGLVVNAGVAWSWTRFLPFILLIGLVGSTGRRPWRAVALPGA